MFELEKNAVINNDHPDLVQGIFPSIEDRWEAGSQCLMRLMEFSLEALKIALSFAHNEDILQCARYINKSSHFTKTGAKMMATFGNIDKNEYDKFRDTRDVHGSDTDLKIIELHLIQREVMTNLIRAYFYNLHKNNLNIDTKIEKLAEQISANSDLKYLTDAMIYADETHKAVFAAHTWVCEKVVNKGEPSIRGNYIEMFQNRDFIPALLNLKQQFKSIQQNK